jgi:16S rRNA G966 N2-methylase RsmD
VARGYSGRDSFGIRSRGDLGVSAMKYMGSKRAMLRNGLGEVLQSELRSARRFVDLFSGSGAVSIHVAQRINVPVVSVDIQKYGALLSGARHRARRAI